MKKFFLASFLVTLLASTATFANGMCEQFVDRESLTAIKTVKPEFKKLAAHEVAMIQAAVLISSAELAQSPEDAVAIFADTFGGRDGDLGGEISYYHLMAGTNNSNSNRKIFAVVTYFPGDNEYGAIFRVFENARHTSPVLVGTITDSDVNCLNPVN